MLTFGDCTLCAIKIYILLFVIPSTDKTDIIYFNKCHIMKSIETILLPFS